MKKLIGMFICIGIAAAIMSPKPLIDITFIFNKYGESTDAEETKGDDEDDGK